MFPTWIKPDRVLQSDSLNPDDSNLTRLEYLVLT